MGDSFVKQELKYIHGDNVTPMDDEFDVKNEPLNGDWMVLWLKEEIKEGKDTNKDSDRTQLGKLNIVTEHQGVTYCSRPQGMLNNSICENVLENQKEIEVIAEPVIVKSTESNISSIYKSHLNKPRFNARGEEPHQCKHCNKCFVHRSQLTNHLARHINGKPYQANQCGTNFSKGHTGNPYRCSQCKDTFPSIDQLKIHTRIHSGGKLHQCSQCKMTFLHKVRLDSHMMIHTREKLYQCSDCGKTFKHNYLLRRHMVVHIEGKPYQCGHCDKAYKYRKLLLYHQKMGCKSGHQCSRCDKYFSGKKSLVSHMITHMESYQYQCSQCVMSFTDKQSLLKHHITHTSEKPEQCTHILSTRKGKYVL